MEDLFDNLDFRTKCDILKEYAHYVTSVKYYHYIIKLYSWNRYFVEMFYDTEEDEIARINVARGNDMNKHLSDIELSDLAGLPGFEAYNNLHI